MKKHISLIWIPLVVIVLVGCITEKEPDMFGYILDKTNQSIFVVSKEAQDYSHNEGGVEEYYDAMSLSNAPKNLEIGQLVKIWYGGPVEESFPGGAKVGKLEVVSVKKKGATLTEGEALKKAAEVQQTKEHLAVRSIAFDAKSGVWEIEWKQIPYGGAITTQVKDE